MLWCRTAAIRANLCAVKDGRITVITMCSPKNMAPQCEPSMPPYPRAPPPCEQSAGPRPEPCVSHTHTHTEICSPHRKTDSHHDPFVLHRGRRCVGGHGDLKSALDTLRALMRLPPAHLVDLLDTPRVEQDTTRHNDGAFMAAPRHGDDLMLLATADTVAEPRSCFEPHVPATTQSNT